MDATAYHSIARYFEAYEEGIKRLEFEEYFELSAAYVNALFEIDDYQKYLSRVDEVIEVSIKENIRFYRGIDIYRAMLLKKAISLFNMLEYAEADYILRELIKIDPYDKEVILTLKKCLIHMHPNFVKSFRALSVLLFIFSAGIILFEVLFVRPFYEAYGEKIELLRNTLFLSGWLVLIGGDFIHRLMVKNEVDRFVRDVRSKIYWRK